MSTYLVDFENVGVGGMDGVEKLSDRDRVVIFYGKQAAAVPFERHIEIASSRAEVRYIKVDKTGKNFLDFQLSSYCGYLIGSTSEKEFIIVSRDNGFGSMEDFWHGKEMSGKKISMKRRPAIAASGEELESVREIIVDKGERQAQPSGEPAKEKEPSRQAEEGQNRRNRRNSRNNRNNRNQGRPQPEGPIKIQTISAENRKQETEPLRDQKENKACEEVGREKKQEERRGPETAKEGTAKRRSKKRTGWTDDRREQGGQKEKKALIQEESSTERPAIQKQEKQPESEKQPETAAEQSGASQKQEGIQERRPYRQSRRRPRGRYVWNRQK